MTFSPNERPGDEFQSGKIVLEGLEPASPFQWDLSLSDLHGKTYFTPTLPPERVCYPFVFAGRIEAFCIARTNRKRSSSTYRPGSPSSPTMSVRLGDAYLDQEEPHVFATTSEPAVKAFIPTAVRASVYVPEVQRSMTSLAFP
jgi:hypothetical protein